MDYKETLSFLYTQLPMFTRDGASAYKPGLNNIITLCKQLGDPQNKFKTIHVAGTNGKGSTSHFLAAILQSAGYKTGLYTSPHLKNFTERIKINGEEAQEEFIVNFVNQNIKLVNGQQFSFFEITTAMAFDYFAKNEVDIAVIEVGLGGRLDSTNVITPELSIITNISFDHTDLLGATLQEIAGEKAGIIKPGIPVIISERQTETENVFIEKAKQVGSQVFWTDEIQITNKGYLDAKLLVDIKVKDEVWSENVSCGLSGNYQLKNLKGILEAVFLLQQKGYQIEKRHLLKGILEVMELTGLQGRWQKLGEHPLIICDTGHNEGGIREIVRQIESIPHHRLWIVLGMVKDKDISMVLSLLPKKAYYIFCQASIPRALEAENLFKKAIEYDLNGEIEPNVNAAIAKARQKADSGDLIFIGGSTFVVAEISSEALNASNFKI